MPSRPNCFTHAAIVFAVPTGSAPVDVGASVEPNAETTRLTPASAYCDLTVARWSAVSHVHSTALSAGPERSRNDRALGQQ